MMATSPDPRNTEDEEAPLISHLIEMRDRMLRIVIAVLLIFLGVFYFANDFYNIVATPLLEIMPSGTSMISTKPAGTFFTPMKLALVLSIFAAMPYILYQMWGFVAPALYRHERRLVLPLLVSSSLLFYAGMAFAYYVVFPLMFKFFLAVAPEGVTVMTDISEYLDFVLKIFFAFGVAFEVPIATILLVWTGMVTPQGLAEKRPYIIVGAFVIGMLLTPPDVISQTMLALPMWILFEAGLWASRYFLQPQPEEETEGPLDSEEAMDQALDRYEADEAELTTPAPGDEKHKP
jgi:sec-independent protein translocase protein TatC